jgi:hypothetical protein
VKRGSKEIEPYGLRCDRLAEGWTPEQISGWLKGGKAAGARRLARTPTRCCRISDTVKHCGDEAAFAAILFDLFCGLLPNRNIFWVSSVLNAES